jgi:hypothetical protein
MRPALASAFVFTAIYFCGCGNNAPFNGNDREPATADTVKTTKSPQPIETGSFIPDTGNFYAAFQLSPKMQAFVIVTYDEPVRPVDSFMLGLSQDHEFFKDGNVEEPTYKGLVDTSGPFLVLHSDRVEEKFKAFWDGTFFIYCTRGIVERKVRSICFSADMCQSSFFAFTFDWIDTARYGFPLVASKRGDYKMRCDSHAEEVYSKYNDSLIKTIRDYSDTIHPVVFLEVDKDEYLVYLDDFKWPFEQRDTHCFFPGRELFKLNEENEVVSRWYDGFDIFGTSCD